MDIRVVTHSGEDVELTVEDYNAKELASQINNNEVSVLEIGGVIFSRIDIKLIKPL